jgi:hypothetical protein
MSEWVQNHATLVWWLTGASAATFVGTLIVVPWLLIRIPADFFSRPRGGEKRKRPRRAAVTRWAIKIGRNLLGVVLVVVGIVMLLAPGQGILTILAGIVFLQFPGKRRFARWIVSRGPVLATINALRRRAGRPPLDL